MPKPTQILARSPFKALRGVRGRKAVDLPALETLLVRFSELVVEQPRLREVDINPVLTSPEQLLALDAHMVLSAGDVLDSQLPRPAIRPEDEPLMVAFHHSPPMPPSTSAISRSKNSARASPTKI